MFWAHPWCPQEYVLNIFFCPIPVVYVYRNMLETRLVGSYYPMVAVVHFEIPFAAYYDFYGLFSKPFIIPTNKHVLEQTGRVTKARLVYRGVTIWFCRHQKLLRSNKCAHVLRCDASAPYLSHHVHTIPRCSLDLPRCHAGHSASSMVMAST